MASQTTKLSVLHRDPGSSRATRRLRRAGQVPGVLYGGGQEPVAFAVEARTLRHALAAQGAVLELEVDGATTPAVLKDTQRDPVRGDTLHVDFLRVRLDVAISATVGLELLGGEEAPGVREGGILEHVTREVTIEALHNDIPERLEADVSAMEVNDTLHLSAVTPPSGVTILDDVEETVVATLTPPAVEADLGEEALEEETERVGDAEGAEAEGADAPDTTSE
jgi:large subunit ribosomal protein L25